jgi:hypothetical protein
VSEKTLKILRARTRVILENLPLALDFDIVDMRNIPDELKAIILREGIV